MPFVHLEVLSFKLLNVLPELPNKVQLFKTLGPGERL